MRRSGILIHPSSLPNSGPCGDLGSSSYRFLDWLEDSGSTLWQVLPLHPPGGGFSPYSSPSAFAGAIYLISLEKCADQGLIPYSDLRNAPWSASMNVEAIENWKMPLIEKAALKYAQDNKEELNAWIEQTHWAKEWGLFSILKKHHGAWQHFPADLRDRKPKALKAARAQYSVEITTELAAQKIFFDQWNELRQEANSRGIQIVGDMPIFIAADGCETWLRPNLFRLNKELWPDPETGAPPDFFSPLGQCWGNPHYAWEEHQKDNFEWWVQRMQGELDMADWVRIDHFRGFAAAWEIPRSAQGDGRQGEWGPTPGQELFSRLKEKLGDLPFIAEDLGLITPDVDELREDLGFMGMKVLQFAFGEYTHQYLPHNYENSNFACYTGTHDNDTTLGWYTNGDEQDKHRYRVYCGRSGSEPHWDLVRLAWSSVAQVSIAPFQDILGLGSEGRMNVPGNSSDNWTWRAADLPEPLIQRLRFLNEAYGRLPEQQNLEE